jgi:hypothetical protein
VAHCARASFPLRSRRQFLQWPTTEVYRTTLSTHYMEPDVQSLVISYHIHPEQSNIPPGFIRANYFGLTLLIIIPPLPHIHPSLSSEVCYISDQAAHYHILSISVCGFLCDTELGSLRSEGLLHIHLQFGATPVENSTEIFIICYTGLLLTPSSLPHSPRALCYRMIRRGRRLTPSPTNNKHKESRRKFLLVYFTRPIKIL